MTTYFIPENVKESPFDRATIKDVRKDIREALDSMIEEADLPDAQR